MTTRKYYLENKEKILKKQSEYYLKNRERYREQRAKKYLEDKDKVKEQSEKYYLKNKEKIKEKNLRYRLKNSEKNKIHRAKYYIENKEKCLVSSAKQRAKKKELPFNITWEDIFIPEICPILLIPLASSSGTHSHNSPTIDRVIPEFGYIKGNVQVISHRANTMKNDATPEELVLFAKWVQRTYPEMF